MKNFIYTLIALAIVLPTATFAAVNNVFDVENLMIDLLGRLGYLFWIVALVFFFWGLVKFINNASDTDEHAKGRQFMVWGIISFFVLVSLWGIVRFVLVGTLNINGSDLNYRDKNGSIVP